jgi:nitroreductase
MEFLDVLKARRAVNHFDPSLDVPDDLLREAVRRATLAPSSFNLQPWNLIVLRDLEARKKLRAVAWDQAKIEMAPVVLIFLGDREGWRSENPTVRKVYKNFLEVGQLEEGQEDWFYGGTRSLYGVGPDFSLAFACKNVGLFAMAFMLAARDLGLDTHPMDGFEHHKVREAFGISERYWVPLIMAVGHFNKEKDLLPPKWRKGWDEIVLRTW